MQILSQFLFEEFHALQQPAVIIFALKILDENVSQLILVPGDRKCFLLRLVSDLDLNVAGLFEDQDVNAFDPFFLARSLAHP